MEPDSRSAAESNHAEAENALEAFRVFVDLYKHHFDLWLKGYLIYLAIVGVTSGFLFNKDTVPAARWFLILFLVTVSVISVAAWTVGLVWLRKFGTTLLELSSRAKVPAISLLGFKAGVWLGLIGAIVITAGALFLGRLV